MGLAGYVVAAAIVASGIYVVWRLIRSWREAYPDGGPDGRPDFGPDGGTGSG